MAARNLAAAMRSPRFLVSWWLLRAWVYTLTSALLPVAGYLVVWPQSDLTAEIVSLCVVLVAMLAAGPWIAAVERQRVRLIGSAPIRNPHERIALNGWARLRFRLGEPATWREVADVPLTTAFGIAAALLHLLLVGTVLGLISAPGRIVQALDSGVPFSTYEVLLFVGLPVALVALLYLIAGLARLQSSAARLVLAPIGPELHRQIARLAASRSRLVRSFEGELRRIERDLHDGAQQRLVSLILALGSAELDLRDLETAGADVARVRASLSSAHDAADAALEDLRATVRAIYPRVLADHGLVPAIRDLVARSRPPVELVGDLPHRLAADVELCAYFVVSEALANVVKHARATRVRIETGVADGVLLLRVIDDGVGGADESRGSGITGLVERAEAAGGHLEVRSKRRAGTTISLLLPARLPAVVA